jgi:SET domain-containing protein
MAAPKYYVARTKRTGRGVFAARRIAAGEKIFAFRGTTVRAGYDSNYLRGKRWLCVGRETWLAPDPRSPWAFLNHSCRPTCGIRGTVTIFATRAIPAGAELTIDYATTEEDPHWRMSCRCGAASCRKAIRCISSLPESLVRRRWPGIPRYLQKSYLRSTGAARSVRPK